MLGSILHTLAGGDNIIDVIGIPNGMQKKESNKSDKKRIEGKIIKRIGIWLLLPTRVIFVPYNVIIFP